MPEFTSLQEDLDRIYFTEHELIDQYYGSMIWACGYNNEGQLGDGSTNTTNSPVSIAGGGLTWKQVACSYSCTAAIKTDGTLWSWGSNTSGQLGDGTTTSRSSPGTTAGGGTNWKQVAGRGRDYLAAIKTDGTLWTWGYNLKGQLGDGTTTSRSSPGTTAGGGTNWKQVSAGNSSTAAIKTDGTLWTWGSNGSGRLGDGTTTSRSSPGTTAGGGTNWKQVACGYNHSIAIKTDGTLWSWGSNTSGQLGDGTTTSRSSPGTTAGGGTNWKEAAGGYNHSIAIKTDGTLWTWGNNTDGRLGDGTTTNRSSPGTTAGGGTNWKQAACSYGYTAAIKTDGTLWTWGGNISGELGLGSLTPRSSPGTTVARILSWKQVACGYYHTVAIGI